MTPLSTEELSSLNAALSSPPGENQHAHDVKEMPLVKERADLGPAIARLEALGPDIVEAFETVLSTKTHCAWAASHREAHATSMGELVTTLSAPVVCVWDLEQQGTSAALFLDCASAQRVIACLMGMVGEETSANDRLGVLDKKIIQRLFAALGEALVAVGLRTVGEPRVDTDWRRLSKDLGKKALVSIAVETSEPLPVRFGLVMVANNAGDQGAAAKSSSLSAHIPSLEVEVTAELGGCSLTLQKLMELTPGVIVQLETTESAPLVVRVQGEPRFGAKASVVGGRICLQLV